jgi:RimJ/RimL family protein N-acetyltransferase
MKLKPIDSSDLLNLVAGWTSQKENYQWLDFGDGKQILSPAWLKIMTQRPTEVVRVFTSDDNDVPIGVVGLTEVNRHFKTARLWGLVGDKSFRVRGYGTRAASSIVSYGFEELGLHAVNTWVVDGNPSLKLIQRVGFRFIGRQRQCHFIDGRSLDRLWFDLLASEHEKILDGNAHTPAEPPGEVLPGAAPHRNSVR